jgi:hypothetical protein
MIERQTIDGRDATIAYLTNKFAPATADTAQYVKVIFDDGEMLFLVTDIPPAPQMPFELRRVSRREQTPHNAAVAGFATAIGEAEKHRRVLKRRFGYTDSQIGTMAMAYNSRKRTP